MNIRFPAALRPFGFIAIGALVTFPLAGLLDQPVSAQSPQAALEARLARIEGSFTALQNQHQQTVAAVAALNTRLAAMQTELQKLGVQAAPSPAASISLRDWSALKTEVEGLKAASALKADVQGVKTTIESEINGLVNEIRTGLQHELAPIRTQMQALQTSVGTFTSGNAAQSVAALGFRMAAVETNGQNMGSKLDTVIANDQSIGSKLDTLLANTADMANRLYMTCFHVLQNQLHDQDGSVSKLSCTAAGYNAGAFPFVAYGQPK
jgi:chromosome segregation ATPase